MSLPEDQQRWACYPLYLREREGLCLVNLSAPDADPTPQLVRVTLSFQVAPSDENAFGSAAERAELDGLVEGFDTALKRTCHAIWVGQLCEPGRLRACFYCVTAPNNALRLELERTLATKTFSIEIADDPEWQFYFEELAPTPLIDEWIGNDGVEASLRKSGDPMTTPREVEHWAYFASESSALEFIREIAKDNFVAEAPENQTEEESLAKQPWCVRFKRDDLPAADEFSPITLSLREAAEQCGGRYDGWEAVALQN